MARGRNRRERIPFGGAALKLDIDQKTKDRLVAEDKVPVWINDRDGRIQAAQQSDYEFEQADKVGDEEDTRRMRRVGTTKEGKAINAYLMSTPREYYEEDQAYVEDQAAASDRAIKGELDGPSGVDPNLASATIKKVDYSP